jgi:hypothetical protein
MDENREIGKNIFLMDSISDEASSGSIPLMGDVVSQSGINGFPLRQLSVMIPCRIPGCQR